jgi:FlaG/FlaF family flagellin (archaellin)
MKSKARRDAVSPWVATAVIIVITVILALILYPSSYIKEEPNVGVWIKIEFLDPNTSKCVLGQFLYEVHPEDVVLVVSVNGSTAGNLTWPYRLIQNSTTHLVWNGSGVLNDVSYFDYNYLGNAFNSGDYVVISGLEPGKIYSIKMWHMPSESFITSSGGVSRFTVPLTGSAP